MENWLLYTALNMKPSYRAQGDSFLLYNGGNNKRKDKHEHFLTLLLERRCVGKEFQPGITGFRVGRSRREPSFQTPQITNQETD